MDELTPHQAQSIDRYFQLLEERPDLFGGREERPIVLDRERVVNFARAKGDVLGIAFESKYLLLVNDLVCEVGSADPQAYLRLVPPKDREKLTGAVVVATKSDHGIDRIVFVEVARHATGTVELELPRGFGESADPSQDALRELAEETGIEGDNPILLGRTFTDTGITSNEVSYFHVTISAAGDPTPETSEGIREVIMLTRDAAWAAVDSGAIRDGFTVQALALYERKLAARSVSDED